jgi:hypothetical protein
MSWADCCGYTVRQSRPPTHNVRIERRIMSKQLEVQCHITTPTTTGEINKVIWVDATLKPKTGTAITLAGDPREWTVKQAYTITREV